MSRRRRTRLSPRQAQDLDGKIFASLYEMWARWEAASQRSHRRGRSAPLPPCPTGLQFRRFLPAAMRKTGRAPGGPSEVNEAINRLKGRGLVRSVPNKWQGGRKVEKGEGRPNYCLLPVRAPVLAAPGNGRRRRKPPRN